MLDGIFHIKPVHLLSPSQVNKKPTPRTNYPVVTDGYVVYQEPGAKFPKSITGDSGLMVDEQNHREKAMAIELE